MKFIPTPIKVLFGAIILWIVMVCLTSCATTTPASVQQKDDRQYNATHPATFRE